MPTLDWSRTPGVLTIGPPPVAGSGPPATLWAYYYDPGVHAPGVNGTLYCYSFQADGTPVGEVASIAAPATGGFSDYDFTRRGLLEYASPNAAGVLALWDENGQRAFSWLWDPETSLSSLTWTDGAVQQAPVQAADGQWYWLGKVTGGYQLYTSGDDYVPSAVGSIGTFTTAAPDEYAVVWIAAGYYCVELPGGSKVGTVPLSGHGGGPFPEVTSALSSTAKQVGPPDGALALQPQQTVSGDPTWVRRVDETGAEISTAWPETSPWGRVGGVDVRVCVQVYGDYYVASGQDNLPATADLHVIIGSATAGGADTPDQDFTLGAHPDHAGVYPSLVMGI